MTRLWLALLFITGASFAALWVVENPGEVTMFWFGYRIDTSPAFLVFLAIALAWGFAYFYTLLYRMARAPKEFKTQRQLTHYRQGLAELTYGVAALATQDAANAEIHARKAQKLLGTTSMGLLISAQVAKSRGDAERTSALLTQLLEHPETEYVAARLLSDDASKQKSLPRALEMAERAYALNPKDLSALIAILSLQIKQRRWQEAAALLNRAPAKRSDIAYWRGLIHLAQGMAALENGKYEEALAAARQAQRSLKGFVPALLLVGRAYDAAHQTDRGVSLLMKAWKQAPHPQLATLLHALIGKLSASRKVRLLKELGTYAPDIATGLWTCRACGHGEALWSVHCPACGEFDTMEWR